MRSDRNRLRFGCFLPVPAEPVDRLMKIAQVNEEAGFDSIWSPDHILFIPPGIAPEAWSLLAATAVATRKAVLGTCVSDPHRYHPAILAQKVATVDQISGGRVILGLGAGEAMNLEPFGIEWKKSVSKLVEAVMIMRKLWAGEVVNQDGQFWRLRDAFLQINPVKSKVPIYFGANGPRTLRLTGEIADGWLSIPLSPRLYKKRLKLVEEGAEKAGRSLEDIDTSVYVFTSVAEKAEDALKQLATIKSQVIASPELVREGGYDIELPEELESLSYFTGFPDAKWVERFLRFQELVPMEAVAEFSIAGTPTDCITKIDEYVRAGVKHLLLINVGPDPRKVVELYSQEIIPRYR